MTSYTKGVLITNVLAGVLAGAVAIFAGGFIYVLIKAFLTTSFDVSLSSSPTQMGNSFDTYGFISVEAVFVGVVLYFGYITVRNALSKHVIEVEVQD